MNRFHEDLEFTEEETEMRDGQDSPDNADDTE